MTRSNLHITLSNGEPIRCVADSSSAPEQGYIVEQLLLPLLSLKNAEKELTLLQEHCTMQEQRSNATYRYEINLPAQNITLYEENYISAKGAFKRGLDLTGRYLSYLKKIESEAERNTKRKFKHLTNQELIARANSLPYFKQEEESTELTRRSLLSNGAFLYHRKGNTLLILKDEQ
ncbi:hypothetical protein KHS38_13880 [Mucilaginibacter sp. Bleaf8]|uniref:hypothetical protein n=1 Tax=Mucilaginibacter sp. Bleaf8 TaxID=2834430 RepID=UPI001BCF1739|nr:hypothetical protein [Mucilaginibacter sp. Bleaf8]MBS7565497.1 hypothetical protein [Mucilaginibacter sp. Bleaf8]